MPKNFFDNKLTNKIKEDPACLKSAGVTSKTIAIEVTGSEGGAWVFHFDGEGHLTMEAGAPSADAACLITTSDKTFSGMLKGKVNVPMAFVMRKIKVKGDSGLAAKMGIALQKVFM